MTSRRVKAAGAVWVFSMLAVAIIVSASAATGWPFAHTFATHRWPGPFGWVATNCPGNMAAGFLQVGIGFLLGYGAHRLGLFDRAKRWATGELHDLHAAHADDLAEVRRALAHIIEHHPAIPDLPPKENP